MSMRIIIQEQEHTHPRQSSVSRNISARQNNLEIKKSKKREIKNHKRLIVVAALPVVPCFALQVFVAFVLIRCSCACFSSRVLNCAMNSLLVSVPYAYLLFLKTIKIFHFI